MKNTRKLYWRDGIFERCHDEINRENRTAIRLLSRVGVPLSAVNLAAQLIVVGRGMSLIRACLLMLYFLLLVWIDCRLLPQDYPHATRMLYMMQAPVMLLSIVLGTVWDPDHQATTILLFLLAMPAFILDRPDRVLGVLAGWACLFLLLCAVVKAPGIRATDMVHVVEFYLGAAAVTTVTLRVRLASLRNLEKAQHHLEHEQDTDCLTRYALTNRLSRYTGRPLVLLSGDLDQLKLFRDFYGHEAGDIMNRYFIRAVMEAFGAEDTYRYGGEMLCLWGGTLEEGLTRIDRCREKLGAFTYEDRSVPLYCAFGYVTGQPKDPDELRAMIQLADIYVHKARRSGQDQTLGGPFDQQRLREGIVESNMSTHARAYEINNLTGLPGMSYFVARADELLASVADVSRQPVMGHFKLLHIRDFNNEFGYAQGDRLIADAAKLLRQHLNGRHVCHISSGQFGILCYRDEAEAALPRVAAALRVYRAGFPVDCKAGFCVYTGSETAISLMDRAKLAEKSILNQGDALLRFYDDRLDAMIHFRQYVVNHVDEAIEKGYLKVYYQPIARAVTGEVCNEEALSRWEDPSHGFLMPKQFIPPLEENGLMYKVNLNVVRQVLRDFKQRRKLGVPIVPISVNLSRRDFEQCDMVREITDLVDDSGLPRSLIKIEITESAFISNQELLRREVNRFRENGFEVWLDDFGSEYSTLNLLQELNFDLIKIDMNFMKNFSTAGKNFIIISDIIDMAKRMGITTLIEGIETQEHLQAMRRLGCEKVQGFLFNKPNSLQYITDRALTGTGLPFESPEAAPYYEAVGRVDLSAPLALDDAGEDLRLHSEMPAGILERREGRYYCLRATESFMRTLEALGMLAEAQPDRRFPMLADPPPEGFSAAAERCANVAGWVNYFTTLAGNVSLSAYLRRISAEEYRGGTAMLVVLLRGQTE